MMLLSERASLGIGRKFTTEGSDPFDEVEWELRDARLIDHRDGSVTFEQLAVEVPQSWSQNATNILAQKYFRGTLGTSERESSLRQVVSRIVDTITTWGERDGYFADSSEAECFRAELVHLLVNQKAAFNSPVWFNIGVEGVPQQASACFILSVDDNMESILNWYAEEGRIFKGGSGAGVNLSRIRASSEGLGGGGTASGPVSFMRGADASAGTIKSGGKTRRAAKMVILDADHPDVEEFIWCKAREERKAHALEAAGFDMTLDGADIHSVQYQNANNSVRVTDEFMQAVVDDSEWALTARGDGSVTRTVQARALLRQIAQASWECADPGIQFDSTINRWNTAANTGRINASNPCSEYLHLDDSACNLASLNLLAFHSGDGVDGFDIEGFAHAARIVFTAQEILVGNADYPTERIGDNARDFRQLGLGYANLGALLMTLGMPYDSAQGRAVAASVTALMTAEAYCQSTRLAARMGPFSGFNENREHMLRVLDQHRAAVADVDEQEAPTRILEAAQLAWDQTCELAAASGVRNAQATVLAPTGTIGLLMDCDTTGVEPDLGLVKLKRLVGGGTMSLINQSVPHALRNLGYSPDAVEAIVDHINTRHSAVGAPGLDPKDLGVFACSLGSDAIHYLGHLKMMGAVQPFISGAISKTVNLLEEATVGEIESLLIESWRMGLKAVALYRDNCKVSQPLVARDTTSNRSGNAPEPPAPEASAELTLDGWNNATQQAAPTVPPSPHPQSAGRPRSAVAAPVNQPVRERLPRTRTSRTFEFRVADCKGFVTVGEYDDGRPGEIFVRVSKQGSTLAGIMDAFAVSLSHGLQYGVPLSAFVRAFVGMRFEPAGMTDDPQIRIATSLMDYLFRRLAVMYLSDEERSSLGILTTDERTQPTLPGVEEQVAKTVQGSDIPPHRSAPAPAAQLSFKVEGSSGAPFCMSCGVPMQRAGACFVCSACGTTSGCS